MDNCLYIGCFTDCEELREKIKYIDRRPLANEKKQPHVTFKYKPEKVDRSLFGEEISIVITGYGNDGENEGLKTELYSENPVIAEMIKNIKVPHITLSVSENGHSVNTSRIEFSPVEKVSIKGVFGACTTDKKIITDKN